MRNIVVIFSTSVFVLFFLSCAIRQEAVIEERKKSLSLLEKLNAYNETVESLQGNAFIVYRDGKEALSFKLQVIAQRKIQNIRLDLCDFVFKNPLVSVIKKSNNILAVIYLKKAYHSFGLEDMDFNSLIGFDIPTDVLLNSLLAKVYIMGSCTEVSQAEYSQLYIEGDKGSERVIFNDDSFPVEIHYTFHDDLYLVTFSKYNVVNDSLFPYRITIKNENRILEINYTEIDIDTSIDDNAFSIDSTVLKDFTELN